MSPELQLTLMTMRPRKIVCNKFPVLPDSWVFLERQVMAFVTFSNGSVVQKEVKKHCIRGEGRGGGGGSR